jgi:hypothetical protein
MAGVRKSNKPSGYSGTPLWKKLGYKHGIEAYVEGAPRNYNSLLCLPAEISLTWLKSPTSGLQFVHLFVASAAMLRKRTRSFREKIHPAGVIWISWPKRSSGVPTDVTEDVVRAAALPLGLVDIKVCSVDDVWSGLKLMLRKDLR